MSKRRAVAGGSRSSNDPRPKRLTTSQNDAMRSVSESIEESILDLPEEREVKVHLLRGETIPFLNGLFTRVVDVPLNGASNMYIFGGSREDLNNSEESLVTNDFFRLNLVTLIWEDLTDQLREIVDGDDPFRRRKRRQCLPELDNPASALHKVGGRTFMLIFGGRTKDDAVSNALFAVDLEQKTWEFIETKGGSVVPRVGAGMMAVGGKLFIFGGWTRRTRARGRDEMDDNEDSFSVLDLESRTWLERDKKYPLDVGSLGYNLDVFNPKLFNGNKLLLFRGKTDDDESIRFNGNFIWVFNTQAYTFNQVITSGDVIPPHTWFDISAHRDSEQTCVLYGSIDKPNRQGEVPSDLWTFDISSDIWKCERLEDTLWNLGMDLQTLEYVPNKGWCLFGYSDSEAQAPPANPLKRKRGRPRNVDVLNDIPNDPSRSASADTQPIWNVCVQLVDVQNSVCVRP